MPETTALSAKGDNTSPDYPGLVHFLLEPLLEFPESFSVDCEQFNQNQRIWIRLALEDADKGRVFGRGGRNIQAIRTVLETAAVAAGQYLYLDIYESCPESLNSPKDFPKKQDSRRPQSPRSTVSKPSLKSRSKDDAMS